MPSGVLKVTTRSGGNWSDEDARSPWPCPGLPRSKRIRYLQPSNCFTVSNSNWIKYRNTLLAVVFALNNGEIVIIHYTLFPYDENHVKCQHNAITETSRYITVQHVEYNTTHRAKAELWPGLNKQKSPRNSPSHGCLSLCEFFREIWPGPILYLLSQFMSGTDPSNQRRRYLCKVSSHWLRPSSRDAGSR